MSTLNDRWQALEPEKKQKVVKGAAAAVVVVFALAIYYGQGRDKPTVVVKEPPTTLELGDDMLQDALMDSVARSEEEVNDRLAKKAKEAEENRRELEELKAQQQMMFEAMTAMQNSAANGADGPADWGQGINLPPSTRNGEIGPSDTPPVPVELIGGIERVSGEKVEDVAKKDKGHRFYLPVGFMPAKVLTGLRAKTVNGSSQSPEPMLLRVQAPAILPNELRSNLEGCFVVAHGYGDLSSERIESRTVSLNCVDANNRAVIEEEITGIVVDKDGVKGLAAHPVSKMGTNLARLAFAAAIEGMGSAFREQATTRTLNPLGGNTTTINQGQIGRVGAGAGVETASKEYKDIIAELVRQQAPVLEMGPGKDVVVALTEGVWLTVRDYFEERTQ